jgi:hypothetical protein
LGQTRGMRWMLPFFVLICGCPTTEEPAEGLALIAEGLTEALLSVRATGPDDVWVVGSDQGDGPALSVWDGSSWTRHDTSAIAGADLWWVHPTASTVFVAGSGGTIASLDRASGELTVVEGPRETVTFFGIWGASADDVWAVGAAIGAGEPPAIWRNQGGVWAAVDLDGELFNEPSFSLFKVHGAAADDLWIVGSDGLILHWDGVALTNTAPPGLDDDLLTVNVGDAGPIVVGGLNNGLIFEQDGDGWVEVAPEFTPALNGVCQGSVTAAVGRWGGVALREGESWTLIGESLTQLAYHACTSTSDGALWAVGGHLSTSPLNDGLIAYDGPATIPSPQ